MYNKRGGGNYNITRREIGNNKAALQITDRRGVAKYNSI
jgi:hypothetical protein